jgi:hypothetical protein
VTASNKAKWEAYQQLNDDDIMDAIQGSIAIPLAIKSDDWEYAQHFIKERIENKMQRRAELAMYSIIKTPSIDADDELRMLRTLWLKNDYRGKQDET